MNALLWLLLGVVLIVVELFTLSLVLGMLGVAALAAALVAFLGGGLVLQSVVFLVSAAALLVLLRPVARRHLMDSTSASVGMDPRSLKDHAATSVLPISESSGQVRINGELWQARPYAGGPPIPAGTPVQVAEVKGIVLMVYDPATLERSPIVSPSDTTPLQST